MSILVPWVHPLVQHHGQHLGTSWPIPQEQQWPAWSFWWSHDPLGTSEASYLILHIYHESTSEETVVLTKRNFSLHYTYQKMMNDQNFKYYVQPMYVWKPPRAVIRIQVTGTQVVSRRNFFFRKWPCCGDMFSTFSWASVSLHNLPLWLVVDVWG